ncbi:Ribulose bisphosphate carboxylase small chain, chloroplastic [Apostasia shenzhenica]|uniref:Ribulose bisphosphate carboxylase small subunit, chloroplastic n=1 Tax=Apostasia shenzhenica TaxID=1088818 RepID=A0A2H9ZVR5_9ASPA|nr:Ribulose bisphosphate carboxylase small chain, chloroplastic [Apostasia shenzhenica]
MASSVMLSSAAATAAAATAVRAAAPSMVAPPFAGLKSSAAFPTTSRRANADLSNLPTNGGRAKCMLVWPIEGKKKFETLSYLPFLDRAQLIKQVEYLIRSGWIPCLEFCKEGFVSRKYHASPGYYDGRYWTMWRLPMFGCTDGEQVMKEMDDCKSEYPDAYIRVIGFDNVRQVQCISFIVYLPPSYFAENK